MSGNESSKNKLLDTMRKTKEVSSAKPAEETAEQTKPQDTKPAAKKPAAAKKSQKKSSDPFQSARRVWPD
jgi:hypothetical protein